MNSHWSVRRLPQREVTRVQVESKCLVHFPLDRRQFSAKIIHLPYVRVEVSGFLTTTQVMPHKCDSSRA